MILLNPGDYAKLTPLTPPLGYHLVLQSVIQGRTPAYAYIDRLNQPQVAFLWKRGKAWLLGSPTDPVIGDLTLTLNQEFYPYLRSHGADRFRLHYDGRWGSSLGDAFPGLDRREYQRSHFHLDAAGKNWDTQLPPGFRIAEIDEALLSSVYGNIERVREETVSERDSVEDFLEKSIGYAALEGDEIVSWCMSEYNTGDRCELGIETVEEYQRRGLATQVARAVIGHAMRRGIRRIGWHCWTENIPSVKTALRIGFDFDMDYPVSVIMID